MNAFKIAGILFGLLGVFCLIMLVYYLFNQNEIEDGQYNQKIVKCYDRFGNEILNTYCIEKEPIKKDKSLNYLLGTIFSYFGVVCCLRWKDE